MSCPYLERHGDCPGDCETCEYPEQAASEADHLCDCRRDGER
jgi:hypothetical protein